MSVGLEKKCAPVFQSSGLGGICFGFDFAAGVLHDLMQGI